jgi:hypothetical protein
MKKKKLRFGACVGLLVAIIATLSITTGCTKKSPAALAEDRLHQNNEAAIKEFYDSKVAASASTKEQYLLEEAAALASEQERHEAVSRPAPAKSAPAAEKAPAPVAPTKT